MKIYFNIVGIQHYDYMGRLTVMQEILKAKKAGKIKQVGVGFEKIGSTHPSIAKYPRLLMNMFEDRGIKGAKQVIDNLFSKIGEDEPENIIIDGITGLAMVEMCEMNVASSNWIQKTWPKK